MLGEATWGELQADYNKAEKSSFGGLFGGLGSFFSKEYATGVVEGARSAVWETPKAAIMSVVQPIRKDVFGKEGVIPMVSESLKGFKLEILKDIAKPIAYTIGHIRHRIFKDLSLTEPMSWLKSGWGLVTLPFAMLSGVGSAALHLPGDLLSLPASIIGATAMTVGSVGQQFFSGLRTFGKGAALTSDTIERSINRFIVPPGWAESRDSEYDNIKNYGQEFLVN